MKKLLILMGLYSSCSFASMDATQVLNESRDRYDGVDFVSNVTLTTQIKDKIVSERKMYMLQKDIDDDEMTIFSVQYPVDLRNVGFLVKSHKESTYKEDLQWLYLPAFRKVRRISPKDKRGAFMGSEFSYFDLDKLRVSDFESKILEREKIFGRDAWKIERKPVSQDVINKSGYYKVVLWIDVERDIILQQDYYDAKDILFKRQKSMAVEKIQDIWTITHTTMENFIEKKISNIFYAETQYNLGMNENLFRKSKLKRGIIHSDVPSLTPITTH